MPSEQAMKAATGWIKKPPIAYTGLDFPNYSDSQKARINELATLIDAELSAEREAVRELVKQGEQAERFIANTLAQRGAGWTSLRNLLDALRAALAKVKGVEK